MFPTRQMLNIVGFLISQVSKSYQTAQCHSFGKLQRICIWEQNKWLYQLWELKNVTISSNPSKCVNNIWVIFPSSYQISDIEVRCSAQFTKKIDLTHSGRAKNINLLPSLSLSPRYRICIKIHLDKDLKAHSDIYDNNTKPYSYT